MKSHPITVRGLSLAAAWLLGGALGWCVVPYFLWGQTVRTYREVAAALPGYLLLGLLVGTATGIGQGLAWRLQGRPGWRWLWASVAGYGLAFPGGVIIGTLIPSIAWGLRSGSFLFMPLTEPGSITYWPFPADLVCAGFLAGLCQWAALRSLVGRPTPATRALWVFGVWLGIGLGLFVDGTVATRLGLGSETAGGLPSGAYRVAWGVGWGVTIGLVSAAVLWILWREAGRLELPATGSARP